MKRAVLAIAAAIAMFGEHAWAADAQCKLNEVIHLPVTMRGTRPMVPASLNGKDVMFLADSGAFMSTLSPALAQELKLDLGYLPGVRITGVGGDAPYAAYTTVKRFTLAKALLPPDVYFMVTPGAGGGGSAGLLGQNVWGLGDVEFDLQGGAIRIFHPEGCGNADIGYWAPGQANVVNLERRDEHQRLIVGQVLVNGVSIRATFDTGASASIMSLRAAQRAGLTPQSPGVTAAGISAGVGSHVHRSWIGTFNSFKVGDEEIKNAKIRFAEIEMEGTDMLLGADFFLSHRVLVANSQHRVYFSYNGGPVFDLNAPVDLSHRPEVRVQPPENSSPALSIAAEEKKPAASEREDPKDAEGFARRGAALAARHDYEHALTDLDHAVQLSPSEAKYYYQRAQIHVALRQVFLAKGDLDQVLKLQPDNVDALVVRAEMNLAARDRAAATADLDAASAHAAKEADIRLTIANTYVRMSLFQRAIESFDPWIGSHGDEVQLSTALSGRCWARAQLGVDLDKALGDCNRAAGLAPGNLNIRAYRGLVQLRRNALDDALADYNAVLAKNPKAPWALYGKAIIELRRGMKTEGAADLAAAKAASPNLAAEAAERGIVPPS